MLDDAGEWGPLGRWRSGRGHTWMANMEGAHCQPHLPTRTPHAGVTRSPFAMQDFIRQPLRATMRKYIKRYCLIHGLMPRTPCKARHVCIRPCGQALAVCPAPSYTTP